MADSAKVIKVRAARLRAHSCHSVPDDGGLGEKRFRQHGFAYPAALA
jgi:hypothetical protein